MTILRRIENLIEGRPTRYFQKINYDSLMNILSLTCHNKIFSPSFNINFRYITQEDSPLVMSNTSLVNTEGFVRQFMQPNKDYKVRGSREGYFGDLTEKHYIEMKKIPRVIFVDKYGHEEDMAPAKRRKMEDNLALSELRISYFVLR